MILKRVKVVCLDFCLSTSVNGLKPVEFYVKWWNSLLWICCLLVTFGYSSYQCYGFIVYFSGHPVSVATRLDHRALDFPSVTICSLNPYKKSLVEEYSPQINGMMQAIEQTTNNLSEIVSSIKSRSKRNAISDDFETHLRRKRQSVGFAADYTGGNISVMSLQKYPDSSYQLDNFRFSFNCSYSINNSLQWQSSETCCEKLGPGFTLLTAPTDKDWQLFAPDFLNMWENICNFFYAGNLQNCSLWMGMSYNSSAWTWLSGDPVDVTNWWPAESGFHTLGFDISYLQYNLSTQSWFYHSWDKTVTTQNVFAICTKYSPIIGTGTSTTPLTTTTSTSTKKTTTATSTSFGTTLRTSTYNTSAEPSAVTTNAGATSTTIETSSTSTTDLTTTSTTDLTSTTSSIFTTSSTLQSTSTSSTILTTTSTTLPDTTSSSTILTTTSSTSRPTSTTSPSSSSSSTSLKTTSTKPSTSTSSILKTTSSTKLLTTTCSSSKTTANLTTSKSDTNQTGSTNAVRSNSTSLSSNFQSAKYSSKTTSGQSYQLVQIATTEPVVLTVEEYKQQYVGLISENVNENTNPLSLATSAAEDLIYITTDMGPDKASALSYSVEDVMFKCTYDTAACYAKDFQKFYFPSYGNCYEFNSDKSLNRFAQLSGELYGLKLLLKIDQSEYLAISQSAGYRVVVHKKSTPVFPETMGFNVSPGYITSIQFRLTDYNKMDPPFGNCMNSVNYSVEGCQRTCQQKFIIEKCGCGDPLFPIPSGWAYCGTKSQTCVDAVKGSQEYVDDFGNCKCLPNCKESFYHTTVTTTKIKHIAQFKSHSSENGSLMKLHVYYDSLSLKTYTEVEAYPVEMLISDIGNRVGWSVGISVISIAEIVVFIIQLIIIPCSKQ